jgi:hypothetical protein
MMHLRSSASICGKGLILALLTTLELKMRFGNFSYRSFRTSAFLMTSNPQALSVTFKPGARTG